MLEKIIHLNSCLSEINLHGNLLPGVDVRIVSLLECSLQLLQLSGGESCPDSPLFPLLCQDAVLARVHLVRQSWQGTDQLDHYYSSIY